MPLDLHKNISIQKFTKDDFADYLCLYQDQAAMKYVTGKALSVEEAMENYKEILIINEVHQRLGFFKVAFSGQFVGLTKLRLLPSSSDIAELGYILLPQRRRAARTSPGSTYRSGS